MYNQFYFKQFTFVQVYFFVHTQLNVKTVLFQTIQFRISPKFQCKKKVLFQTIQFIMRIQFISNGAIDRILSGAITLNQSGHGHDGNKRELYILQSSNITGTSTSDCLMSYSGCSLKESYPSSEKQSVYSTAPADLAISSKVNFYSPAQFLVDRPSNYSCLDLYSLYTSLQHGNLLNT